MPISLDIQQAELVSDWQLTPAIQEMLDNLLTRLRPGEVFECAVCFVDSTASAELNQQYRQKSGATNILSFPYDELPGVETNLLGDLVICAEVVMTEADAQKKTVAQHLNHLLVHGILHLLGYDHLTEEQANIMEALEIEALQQAGYPDPYTQIDP